MSPLRIDLERPVTSAAAWRHRHSPDLGALLHSSIHGGSRDEGSVRLMRARARACACVTCLAPLYPYYNSCCTYDDRRRNKADGGVVVIKLRRTSGDYTQQRGLYSYYNSCCTTTADGGSVRVTCVRARASVCVTCLAMPYSSMRGSLVKWNCTQTHRRAHMHTHNRHTLAFQLCANLSPALFMSICIILSWDVEVYFADERLQDTAGRARTHSPICSHCIFFTRLHLSFSPRSSNPQISLVPAGMPSVNLVGRSFCTLSSRPVGGWSGRVVGGIPARMPSVSFVGPS